MVENIDIDGIVKELSAEFDALIDERQEVRAKSAKLKARADEIERKLSGIQTSLHGLTQYATAQEAPTELMKKTTVSMAEAMSKMKSLYDVATELQIAGPDVKKTLSECCRDILRAKKDWMSPVQVREALLAAGFDFSSYTSNPLSSIHTTLKRMVPDEIEAKEGADGQVYRWKTLPPNFVPMNTPGTELRANDPARKLGEGARFPKRVGDVTGPTSAYDSGMRGIEKPKAKK